MLIDKDSPPRDTILYLSAKLLAEIKRRGPVDLDLVHDLYQSLGGQYPLFKFSLALSFLFLAGRVDVKGGELCYVPGDDAD